jgi:hypothetical protein
MSAVGRGEAGAADVPGLDLGHLSALRAEDPLRLPVRYCTVCE